MSDSNEVTGDSKADRIPKGPSVDDLLEKQGIPNQAPVSAPTAPSESVGAPLTTAEEVADTAAAPKKEKSLKPLKVTIALALLEKLSAKGDNFELKTQTELALAGLEMTSFERAIAQSLNVAGGSIDRSEFVLDNFKSKKLLAYAIKCEPPLLPTDSLVEMTIDTKYKANLAALTKALKFLKDTSSSELENAVRRTLRVSLQERDEKTVSTWIEKVILPLQIALSSDDGSALLASLYGKIDPKKGASSGLKELLSQSIELLTQSQNLGQLDAAISNAAGLGAGSYATIIDETRKMPFKVGSARYLFVMSLVRPRERKTVTFLAQSGIFKAFTLDGIGLLADNEESFSRISENDPTLEALKDECRRRLKSEELSRVHYWLLKYPNVRNWLTDAQIIQRLRPQDDYLSQLLFEEGRKAGASEAGEQVGPELQELKIELQLAEKQKTEVINELEVSRQRAAELENRLREVANSAQGAKDDQVRQAQIDSIKVLIDFMNSIEMSSIEDAGLKSALESARAKFKAFGVSWRYEIGSIVPFVEHDHLASNIPDGAPVKILTPCYYMANTQTQIALVKARVLPQ
jgi:hypothetical protein